jgi:flavodoxin
MHVYSTIDNSEAHHRRMIMKALVVYYSKSGTTKKIAERIAKKVNADIEALVDKKKRSGLIGWLVAGRDGMKKNATEIASVKYDPANYDIVIIGGPLWGFNSVAPATRTYLAQNKDKIKKVAFFMTRGGSSPSDKALTDLKELYGRSVAETLDLRQGDIDSDESLKKLEHFASSVTAK